MDLINYYIAIDCFTFRTKAVFELYGFRYAIFRSVLLISTYERPQNVRVRELILENHDAMKWQLVLMV